MVSKKVLFLHGFTQTGEIFKQNTATLSKRLQEQGFLSVYITAPHHAANVFFDTQRTGKEAAWWNMSDDWQKYIGVEESITYLTQFAKDHGPFVGIVGFSQGACMAAVFGSIVKPQPKFMIMSSGFVPGPKILRSRITANCRSLTLSGKKDVFIRPTMSQALADIMKGDIQFHEGGHVFPNEEGDVELIMSWVEAAS